MIGTEWAGLSPENIMGTEEGRMLSPKLTDEFLLILGCPSQLAVMANLMMSLLLFNVFITFSEGTNVYLFKKAKAVQNVCNTIMKRTQREYF